MYSPHTVPYVSWYSISIHYFSHLFLIYGIKTLLKIYKHQIKVCQVLHALFYDYTLLMLSPFILLGPHVTRLLVTTAWCILSLQMEKTASSYGE
jgi:hypothetical protein